MPLDSVDRRMLAILQEEGRISNAALAERLHLSPSPCLRRLRALEQDGVISRYRAELDRPKLGLGLTVFVELKVDLHNDRTARTIADTLRSTPEVVSAHIVSGPSDFRLEVVVADLAAFERLHVREAAQAAARQRRALGLRAAHGQGRGRTPARLIPPRYHGRMAMTLRLSDEQTEALRVRAAKEGRSMQQVALDALDDYLMRARDDELTDRLAERGAARFAEVLRRLGE